MAVVDINWMAVVVSALVYVGIGMIWYGPLFGKQWMALMGYTKKNMKDMKLTPKQAMFGGLISSLVLSAVLSKFVDIYGAVNVPMALKLAFCVWLGFVATFQLGGFLWENKPFKLFVLNTAHALVSLMVMASILAVWV
jgi:hypothetical protein